MVQRLEWDACDAHGCHCDIVASEDGDMVSYEDYAELQQTLAAARTYVNDAAKTDAHAFGLLQAINRALKND